MSKFIKQLVVNIFPLLICILIITIFRANFAFGLVDGESMESTFHNGDVILNTSKSFSDIGRGDVITFYSYNLDEVLIKRVVAIEGDTVEIKSDGVYINDKLLNDTSYIKDGVAIYEPMSKVKVPSRSYFVLGDNRNISKDSRSSSVGFVSYSDVCYKVVANLSSTFGASYKMFDFIQIILFVILMLLLLDSIFKAIMKRRKKESNKDSNIRECIESINEFIDNMYNYNEHNLEDNLNYISDIGIGNKSNIIDALDYLDSIKVKQLDTGLAYIVLHEKCRLEKLI